MEQQNLYNDSAKKTSGTANNNQGSNSTKSEIKPGMSAKEIGNVISNRLMSHVDKAVFSQTQKKK